MLPFQKGYLVNWEHQKTIWDYLFSPTCCGVEPSAKNIIFSEPYFNFCSLQEGLNEVLFEEYRFRQVLRTTPADLSCYRNRLDHPEEPCCLVVDAGYSFTHVVPFIDGKRQKQATKRLDVGGKLLTNHLKDIISYR
jgi:actin-related protein 6